ncbi:MAG TPA: MFS transporter, partial [Planctomycetota bacterium]|nr:MFS transporter [Planctomycetota bacterium]
TNCVGTANAFAAGWGNMGGGAANAVMPFIFTGLVAWGVTPHSSWRLAMIVPGIMVLATGVCYYLFTQDCPAGNFDELRKRGESVENSKRAVKGGFWIACKDYRVWILALVYGSCFGVEVVMHGTAQDNFQSTFSLSPTTAGLIAGAFGGLAIFARGLGGYISDKIARKNGLKGRVLTLATYLLLQSIAMLLLSKSSLLAGSVTWLLIFGLFVHMAAGGTYAVIPFINKKVLGSVAGIVGAGGNMGAMLGGFLLKVNGVSYWQAIAYMGIGVFIASVSALAIRFNAADESIASTEFAAGAASNAAPVPAPAILATGE